MTEQQTHQIHNAGSRRVILGRPPKSVRQASDYKGRTDFLVFGTADDHRPDIAAEERDAMTHDITAAEAKRLEAMPVYQGARDLLKLSTGRK